MRCNVKLPASNPDQRGADQLVETRRACADLIDLWHANPAIRDLLLLKIRTFQDVLGRMRQRNLGRFARTTDLAWVDSWEPPTH